MGVEGAAVATVFSQIFPFLISFVFIKKLQDENKFKLTPKYDFSVMKNIILIKVFYFFL